MIRVMTFAGFVLVGGLLGSPTQAENITLRYNNWVPPTYFMHERGLYKFFDDVKKVTEGRVTIEPSANALGPVPRNYQITVDGIGDVGWGVHGYTPGTFPLAELVELPFETKSAEANSVAYWRVYKKFFEPTQMHKGVHTLTVHVNAPGHICTTRVFASVDELKGMRLRSTGSGVSESYKRLGITPVGAPVTETREMLSRGIIDGLGFGVEAIYNFNVNKYIKQVTRIPGGLYSASFFLVVNQSKWNSISEKDRDAIMEIAGEKLARNLGRVWDDEEASGVEKAKRDGIKLYDASGDFLSTFKERLKGFDTEWVGKAKKLGVDGAAALEMYRREAAAN